MRVSDVTQMRSHNVVNEIDTTDEHADIQTGPYLRRA